MKCISYKIGFIFIAFSISLAQFNYNLEECISIALDNKKTIQSSKLGLEVSRKAVVVARSELLPGIGLTYNNIQNRFN